MFPINKDSRFSLYACQGRTEWLSVRKQLSPIFGNSVFRPEIMSGKTSLKMFSKFQKN